MPFQSICQPLTFLACHDIVAQSHTSSSGLDALPEMTVLLCVEEEMDESIVVEDTELGQTAT
jgi:hypothetical protein